MKFVLEISLTGALLGEDADGSHLEVADLLEQTARRVRGDEGLRAIGYPMILRDGNGNTVGSFRVIAED